MTANVSVEDTPINIVVPTPIALTVSPKTIGMTVEAQPPLIMGVGVQGPPGPAGGTTTTVFNFTEPSMSWSIAHFLNRYPSVTLIDTAGDQLFATVSYVDRNNIVAQFSALTSGVAYLN